MATARDKQQWNHTANLIAAIVNARPFAKGRPVKADQFRPYLRKRGSGGRGIPVTKDTLKFLAIAMNAEGAPKE